MVVLDKKDYIEKAQELLVQPAYGTTERGPTNKLVAPTNFMVCPKSTKQAPLRPIVSSRGSVTYGVTKILRPLVAKSLHHIQSTKDFVNKVSKVTLLLGECLCSYDVLALFTSVPIDAVLNKGIIGKGHYTVRKNCIINTEHN